MPDIEKCSEDPISTVPPLPSRRPSAATAAAALHGQATIPFPSSSSAVLSHFPVPLIPPATYSPNHRPTLSHISTTTPPIVTVPRLYYHPYHQQPHHSRHLSSSASASKDYGLITEPNEEKECYYSRHKKPSSSMSVMSFASTCDGYLRDGDESGLSGTGHTCSGSTVFGVGVATVARHHHHFPGSVTPGSPCRGSHSPSSCFRRPPLMPGSSTSSKSTVRVHGANGLVPCWMGMNPEERARARAALAVLGGFVALFCTFGLMNSFGTFNTFYSSHQLNHLSPSRISWIGSLQLCVFFFSGGFIGRIFDAYGPTWLMVSGSVCYALSIVATAFSTQYAHYMVSQGLLFGLATGLLFYPSLASVSTHFSKYRATAMGIVAAGSSVGGVIYPIMLQKLFAWHGFRDGILICGLSSALMCIFSSMIVTAAPRPQRAAKQQQVQNCSPLCKSGTNQTSRFSDLKLAITDMRYLLLVVGSGFVALGLFIPIFYIISYAHYISTTSFNPYYVLAILNAGGIFGRIAPAYLSDSLGHFNLLFPSALFSGLSCVTLWLGAKNLQVLLAFAAVYGFWSGAFVSLIAPCVVRVSSFERGDVGTRIGLLYSVISVPSLVGNPIAGALLSHDPNGSYTGTIIFAGATVMLGSVFIFMAKCAIERKILARV